MSREVPRGWTHRTLRDIAVNVAERWEPGQEPDLPYIGLEHLGQGTGTVLGLGTTNEVTSAKTRFRPGDVLFGKLRPNLRKTALVGTAGVASTDILVLRPRAQVDSSFLFYRVSADDCFEHASKSSAGTKMPRTSWGEMGDFALGLPELPEQRRIAEILSSVDEAIQTTQSVIEQTQRLRACFLSEFFHRGNWEERKPLPEGWTLEALDDIAKRGSGHTPSKSHPEYWNGGVGWVSLQDTKRLDRVTIYQTTAEISLLGVANSSAVIHPADTVIVSRDATVGRSAITTKPMAVSQHFIAWQCSDRLDSQYFYYWLQGMKDVFERIGAGSTIKTIGLAFFKSLALGLPPISKQREIGRHMLEVDQSIFQCEASVSQLQVIKHALMSDLLIGRKRVTSNLPLAAE